MIIPDNISPLPVFQPSGDRDPSPENDQQDFVCESAVRQLLVGPMRVAPLTPSRVPDGDAFAGRDDLDESKPFTPRQPTVTNTDKPAREFRPRGPHPALAKPRTAAPPHPRVELDTRIKRRRLADHWWVLGMGAAMLAVIASGALIELVSNNLEASAAAKTEPAELSESDKVPANPSLAASNPEYPAP